MFEQVDEDVEDGFFDLFKRLLILLNFRCLTETRSCSETFIDWSIMNFMYFSATIQSSPIVKLYNLRTGP